MEAMEGLDSLAEEPNQSIRAVAKLAGSEEVCISTHGLHNLYLPNYNATPTVQYTCRMYFLILCDGHTLL